MLASRSMAFFAADVPLGDCLGLDIVVDGMAAVTKRTGRTLCVTHWIELGPPVGAFRYVIGAPDSVRYVPLGAEREIIVADFLEVSLLPFCAIDERYVVLLESDQWVSLRKIGKDHFRVYRWIGHHVGHPCFAPARIDR